MDLSCFNDPSYNIDAFLDSIERLSEGSDMFSSIDLPSTLLYVGLPKIQSVPRHLRIEKLARIFNWLKRRNVESILKIQIPDLEYEPYREDDIEKCLTKFKEIEELNWVKLDMSLEVLGDSEGKIHGVRKIWLYSANWGMINYWTGLEGVVNYSQVSPCTSPIHLFLIDANI